MLALPACRARPWVQEARRPGRVSVWLQLQAAAPSAAPPSPYAWPCMVSKQRPSMRSRLVRRRRPPPRVWPQFPPRRHGNRVASNTCMLRWLWGEGWGRDMRRCHASAVICRRCAAAEWRGRDAASRLEKWRSATGRPPQSCRGFFPKAWRVQPWRHALWRCEHA